MRWRSAARFGRKAHRAKANPTNGAALLAAALWRARMAEGLVVRTKNKTARIANPSREDAIDVLEVRQHVESIVVERLAGRLRATLEP